MNDTNYTQALVADMLSMSKATLLKWEKSGKLTPQTDPVTGNKTYAIEQLLAFEPIKAMYFSNWDKEMQVVPHRNYRCIELFAGAGGLALGLEQAGFSAELLNDIDPYACQTLTHNRPSWNVCKADISTLDFTPYKHKIDLLSGGFPCQAFSYAGKKLGFEDTRGTLFYEFGRALSECCPKIFIAENVKGLASHDHGRTLQTIKHVFSELGYQLIEPKILQAIFYKVPQKRERLILVGIRNDLASKAEFSWPAPFKQMVTLKDALKKGILYNCDVPHSNGQSYPKRKAEILSHVPPGGYWRDLPIHLQKEYMQKSFYLGGGKTGMARRLSWNEPSLTLTCAPAQKQTERCHPDENRPLTVREYARIQTFPDHWLFQGSLSQQYKQIGNAVPVNLALAIGKRLIALLNSIEEKDFSPMTHESMQAHAMA